MYSRIRSSRYFTLLIVALVLCLTTLVCVSCGSTTALSKSKQASLQKTLNEQMARYKVPGAIVGMWFGKQGTWVVGAGKGNTSTGAAPQTTDKTRIGSISKTFTATVILQLVDEKKLSLDDKLSKY